MRHEFRGANAKRLAVPERGLALAAAVGVLVKFTYVGYLSLDGAVDDPDVTFL